jgi:hypothetical protein
MSISELMRKKKRGTCNFGKKKEMTYLRKMRWKIRVLLSKTLVELSKKFRNHNT